MQVISLIKRYVCREYIANHVKIGLDFHHIGRKSTCTYEHLASGTAIKTLHVNWLNTF